MSKKRRNDIAKRSAIARGLVVKEVKEEKEYSYIPEVVLYEAPRSLKACSYNEFLELERYEGIGFTFPYVRNTYIVETDDKGNILRSRLGGETFLTRNVYDATMACLILQEAKARGIEKLDLYYDIKDNRLAYDPSLFPLTSSDFLVKVACAMIRNKNLSRAIDACSNVA